jgi:tetratricopeptide (TPR) repeat protein
LPFAALLAIVTLVLTWDFLVNQTGSEGPFAILWNAFSSRIDRTTFEVISSPGLWLVLILTWLAGGWLALIERAPLATGGTSKILVSRRSPTGGGRKPGLTEVVAYLAATLGVFLVYGLVQAWRMGAAGLEGLDVLRRVAAHVVFFDLCLLLLMVLLAAALRLADPAPRPAAWTQRQPVVVALAGLVLGALGLAIILRVNVRPIQADTYYKQGLAYEEAGSWEGAIVLYREAAGLQPSEDFYDLFLGRALLQLATMTQEGGSILLPEDVSNVPARELLSVVDQGIRSLSREDILRATNAILTAARRNNPLNTDHSANLGRLYRSWAFSSAISPDKAPDNQLLRDLVQQSPDQVHLPRLEQARRYYEEAVALSPHNVQLLNELATVHYILGDNAGALATLDRSAAVDPRYGQTYLLRGDALSAAGDRGAALDAYRQAAEIAPNDLNIVSAIGVLSAQLGQTDAAVDAFNRIVAGDAGSLSAAEGELAGLDVQAAAAGGYEKLTSAARDRRAALQTQIAALQSQLHLTHRNLALVLRDAGRTAEALQAAQEALTFADETQRPAIESLIADLRSARLRQDGSSP